MIEKKCKNCGKIFETKNKTQVHCKKECAEAYSKDCAFKPTWCKDVGTCSVGMIGELMVSADLLKKGFMVFKNISPKGIYDMVAVKDGKFYGIDVKTGYYNKHTEEIFINRPVIDKYKAEYKAVVIHETNQIVYIPEI